MSNLSQAINLLKIRKISCQIFTRHHRKRDVRVFDAKWRQQQRLPDNPNAFGPLINLPDYSFKDGRTVPYGTNQKVRIDKQRQHLETIKKLVGQVDYAVERHALMQKQWEEQKQQIIDSKLKEKGQKLLTSESTNGQKLLTNEN